MNATNNHNDMPQLEWNYKVSEYPNVIFEDNSITYIMEQLDDKIKKIMHEKNIQKLHIEIDKDTNLCGLPSLCGTEKISFGLTYINLIRAVINFCYNQGLLTNEKCDEILCYALYHAILHEIGHVLHNSECSTIRTREDKADYFANEIICTQHINDKHAIIGVVLSKIVELHLDILIGRNPGKSYGDHPSTLERIDKVLLALSSQQNITRPLIKYFFNLFVKIRPILHIVAKGDYKNIMSVFSSVMESTDNDVDILSSLDDDE